jgi:hypothetical protein
MGDDADLTKAVDAALDAALGPVPAELVEERPEVVDPSKELELAPHLNRSPERFYGIGG